MAYNNDQQRTMTQYMGELHRSALLTREQEQELAARWVATRDEAAAEELVRRNLRFVVKVAMGYRKYGVPLSDLIQEGNLGLMRAVEKFDPSRKTRLISYAVWWIKAYMQSHILQTWSLVRIGTTQAQRRLFYKLPRELSAGRLDGESEEEQIERLAETLHAKPREVVMMMNSLRGRDLSLNAPLDEDGGTTFVDRVEDPGVGPEQVTCEQQDAKFQRRLLEDAVARLSDREATIIRLRHQGEDVLTLREVGERLGLSRERVRQLESQALRKLKAIMVPKYRRSA